MSPEMIDDLARALPPYRPEASRVEQVRTAVLAGAPTMARPRRMSRRTVYVLAAAALLTAVAAAAVWMATRDATPDAPEVQEPAPAPPRDTVIAERDEAPVVPEPVVAIAPVPTTPARRDETAPAPRAPTVHRSVETAAPSVKTPIDAPGEAEFRAGWAALKSGAPDRAAVSFEAARTAKGSAVAEDASFWEAIALARAGAPTRSIAALRRFLDAYPSSARAGEAAAKLGWLLYDAGDLDDAERRFRAAADDVVPKVQKSARDGLAAIARERGAP